MKEPVGNLVVIGGGMTGLSTALAWARNVDTRRHPVVVLEKQPILGGCVTSYRRRGFLFDTVQMMPDVSDLLDYFGVRLSLKRFDGYFTRIFLADPQNGSTRQFPIPSGRDAFEQMLVGRFPTEARRIRRLLGCSRAMYEELRHLKVEPGPLDLVKTLVRCPRLVRNAGKTFRQYVDGFGIEDPTLRDILDVFAAFSALPSERVAAPMTVSAMFSTLQGTYRPYKGFIELPYAFKKRLVELGGEARTGCRVEKVLIDSGQVRGVKLASGEIIEASHVVTTIDPKVAMGQLVDIEKLRDLDASYADKVESVEMSTSSMHISLGLDEKIDLASLGMDCGYNVITTGRGVFEELFAAAERGEMPLTDDRFHTAVICPSLTTGQNPTLIIRAVPMAIGNWTALRRDNPEAYARKKEKVADFFVDKVERYLIPGLREHIVTRDIATPATFARYLGSPTGSNYDMAPYPGNFGRARLRMRTPVRGLLQPKFCHGILPSMQAGMQAVDMILGGAVMGGYSRFTPPKRKSSPLA